MERKKKTLRKQDKIISGLGDEEIALISLILMNKGRISETKLKRIYLEKYSYWEMQRTEKKLMSKELLLKRGEKKSGEELEYKVPEEFVGTLSKSFFSKVLHPYKKKQLEPFSTAYCGAYSILWYLWRTDSLFDYHLFRSKSGKSMHLASERKVEESLGIEKESARFLVDLLKGLSTAAFWSEDRHKKWSDVLISPHMRVKEIFTTAYDALRESSELGRDDVGKDNVDFFFEELAELRKGQWYALRAFLSNARSTLSSCNMPFRWIHFDKKSVWSILNQKLRMLGVVETGMNNEGERFLRLTSLGGYCVGRIPEKKLVKMHSSRRGKFLVHPNFEVMMVSKELNPKVPLQLAMFSHPTKLDTVSVFRISRESVKEGIRLGLKTDEMISFLKENSKGEIPQNVEYSVKDWGE